MGCWSEQVSGKNSEAIGEAAGGDRATPRPAKGCVKFPACRIILIPARFRGFCGRGRVFS
jgi:hypothetical protein